MPNLYNQYKSTEQKITQKRSPMDWLSAFRGENINVYDVQQTLSSGKTSPGLWFKKKGGIKKKNP
jgi:uncharacterized phage-associated protein